MKFYRFGEITFFINTFLRKVPNRFIRYNLHA